MSTEELINSLVGVTGEDTELSTERVVPLSDDDVPLIDEDKARVQKLLDSLTPTSTAPESEWDEYLWNSGKMGLTDSIAIAGATMETFFTDPLEYYAKNPSKLFDNESWEFGIDSFKSAGNQWLQNYNKWETGVALGDPKMPKTGDWMVDWTGTGVRTATDPATYVIGAPKTLAKGGAHLLKLFGIGVGSEAGGEAGATLAEGTEYEQEARLAGTLVGGVASPTVGTAGVKIAGKPIKQIWDKVRLYKTNPDLVNQQYSGGAAKRFLELAAKEEGVEDLTGILNEFSSIKHLLGDNAKGIPLFVQMADNPIIKSQVVRLIKTDPDFRKVIDNEIHNIANQIDMKADIFFGPKYRPLKGTENFPSQVTKRVNNLIKARQVVDDRIEKLSHNLVPGLSDTEIGNKISKLVARKEKMVREEMSPLYDSLKKEARNAKVFMSANDTANIYNFVKNNRIRDIFGKGTPLDKKIMSYLEPRVNASGLVVKPKLSFEQVDSLKREINRIKRSPLTQDEARKLKQLEEVVNTSRKNMPGDYNSRLEGLDKAYYERVGVPYGSDTIKLMGSKKYIEEVVPVILKNESSLKQFLNAAGDEGTNIARLAYGAKIYDKTVKNGVVNLQSLRALLKKDKSIIDSIPGMQKEIDSILVDNGRLFHLKRSLDVKVKQAEKEAANNFLNRYVDYHDIANKLAGRDLNFFRKIQKDMKYLDQPVKSAINKNIQRQFIDHIFENTQGKALAFLKDPKNKAIVNEVFGQDYMSDLQKLAKLSDSLDSAKIGQYSSNLQARKLDWLAKHFPGLDIPYVASQGRDRISSNIMKGTRILSKFKQAQLQASTDEQLKEVLLDPKSVKKIANLAETFEFKIDNPFKLQEVVGVLSETLPSYSYAAGKVEVRSRQEEEETKINGIKY